jgi:hypothetical protein
MNRFARTGRDNVVTAQQQSFADVTKVYGMGAQESAQFYGSVKGLQGAGFDAGAINKDTGGSRMGSMLDRVVNTLAASGKGAELANQMKAMGQIMSDAVKEGVENSSMAQEIAQEMGELQKADPSNRGSVIAQRLVERRQGALKNFSQAGGVFSGGPTGQLLFRASRDMRKPYMNASPLDPDWEKANEFKDQARERGYLTANEAATGDMSKMTNQRMLMLQQFMASRGGTGVTDRAVQGALKGAGIDPSKLDMNKAGDINRVAAAFNPLSEQYGELMGKNVNEFMQIIRRATGQGEIGEDARSKAAKAIQDTRKTGADPANVGTNLEIMRKSMVLFSGTANKFASAVVMYERTMMNFANKMEPIIGKAMNLLDKEGGSSKHNKN